MMILYEKRNGIQVTKSSRPVLMLFQKFLSYADALEVVLEEQLVHHPA